MRHIPLAAFAASTLLTFAAGQAPAAPFSLDTIEVLGRVYKLTAVDVPGRTGPFVQDINNVGQVVGTTGDGSGAPGRRGFLRTGADLAVFAAPGAANGTQASGVNDAGHVVGSYGDAAGRYHGFVYAGGTFTTLDAPGARDTYAGSIDEAGRVAGTYVIGTYPDEVRHGFVYEDGRFTTVDVPGARDTGLAGINDAGVAVGWYGNSNWYADGGAHGFMRAGNDITTIDAPGMSSTYPNDINGAGQVVGTYYDGYTPHGFLYANGRFATVDHPLASVTFINGINDAGQIVGFTERGGFLATPAAVPEPAGVVLLGFGLLGAGLLRRKRI